MFVELEIVFQRRFQGFFFDLNETADVLVRGLLFLRIYAELRTAELNGILNNTFHMCVSVCFFVLFKPWLSSRFKEIYRRNSGVCPIMNIKYLLNNTVLAGIENFSRRSFIAIHIFLKENTKY